MELKLTSPSFKEGEFIDKKFSGYGIDISPELNIENLSKDAVSLILTLDDADHPRIKNFNHWIAFNVDPVDKIPEHLPKGGCVKSPINMQQGMAYGNFRYRGPKTPKGETHHYVYTVYVLDIKIKANRFSNKKKIMKLAEGHIIQQASLTGLFTPNR